MRELCRTMSAVSLDGLLALFADAATIQGTGSTPCPCSGKEEIRRAIQPRAPDFVIVIGTGAINPQIITRVPARPDTVFWQSSIEGGGQCARFAAAMRIAHDKISSLVVDKTACDMRPALPRTGAGRGGRSLPTAFPVALLAGVVLIAAGVGRTLALRRA